MDDDFKELERKWLKRKKRREYNETHKDQYKKYRENNKEKIKIMRREWYAKNKDIITEKLHKYYETHPEAKQRKYEKMKEWQRNNKEKVHAYFKKYYENNPDLPKAHASKTICGLECSVCGFNIKSPFRKSVKRKIKCPCCRKIHSPCDLKKITIERATFKSVYDIEKERADKKEFEELVHKRFIEKGLLSA